MDALADLGRDEGKATVTLLTIVTRTYKRPTLLARCVASVQEQTRADLVEQVILYDETGMGIGRSHREIARRANEYHGDYVYVLDDDDWLCRPTFAAELAAIIECAGRPDVVMVRLDHMGRLLPSAETWGRAPVCGHIGFACYILRRDVFMAHCDALTERYEGDYDLIAAVWGTNPRVVWHDEVCAQADGQRRGQAE
jgi:hypothetical protein